MQTALIRESIAYSRFDGTMDLKKRQAAIKTFKDPNGPDGRPRPMVLLISLKAGGVGLNLTNANHAFMVGCLSLLRIPREIWFSSAFHRWIAGGTRRSKAKVSRRDSVTFFARAYSTPTLAIDRLHRVTQERTVYVKHFIVRCCPLLLSGNMVPTLSFPRSKTQSKLGSFKSRNAKPRSSRKRSKGKERVAKNTMRRARRI